MNNIHNKVVIYIYNYKKKINLIIKIAFYPLGLLIEKASLSKVDFLTKKIFYGVLNDKFIYYLKAYV
jgi:hypothetical protein